MPKPSLQIQRDEHDGTNLAKKVNSVGVAPTDGTKNNPSFVYTYSSGDLTKITMTIGTASYEKTFTWTGDDLTGETVWTKV